MPEERSRRILGTRFIRLTLPEETYTGILVSREPVHIGDNDTYRYQFEDEQGKATMNGTDQIDDALADVEMPMTIEVKFLGTERTLGGFDVKRFEVTALEEVPDGTHTGKAKSKAH